MTAAKVPFTADSAQGCVKNGKTCLINKACRTAVAMGGTRKKPRECVDSYPPVTDIDRINGRSPRPMTKSWPFGFRAMAWSIAA